MTTRRQFLAAATAAAGAATGTLALAQAWPSRPIRIVNPYTAGGSADTVVRPLAQALSDALGQSVIIDNRPGANTIVGAEAVKNAPPDGYTLLLSTSSTLATNPAAYKNLPYDPLKDFTHVAKVVFSHHVVAARKGLPANSIAELVALARKNPGSIRYASTGVGSAGHLSGLALEAALGVRMQHVPYKGSSQVTNDLMAEVVDITCIGPSPFVPHIRSGRLKGLAVTSAQRMAPLPDVPTMVELGYKDFLSGAWYAISARAGTPPEIVARLNREINAALKLPALRKIYEAEGFTLHDDMNVQQTARFVADEVQKWGKIVRDNNIVFE